MQRRVSVRVVIYTQMDVCVRNTSPEHVSVVLFKLMRFSISCYTVTIFLIAWLFLPVLDPTVPNVQVTKMVLVCDTAPNNLVLDLTGK